MTILLAVLAVGGCGGGPIGQPQPDRRQVQDTQEDHYSILLISLRDPDRHIQLADYYKRVLTEKIGWKGLFVINKAGHSELYWGRYRSQKDAWNNLKTAKAYRAANGVGIFAQAMVIPLPGKDIGPPDWNLRNVSAPYSLLVAVFKDDPDRNYVGRRRFAVDYCRRLRENGYEGYFYHSRSASHVTIGAFSRSAVTVRQGLRGNYLDVNDPKITSLQRDFPFLALNGTGITGINEFVLDRKTGRKIPVPKKTYLIRVPRKGEGIAYGP